MPQLGTALTAVSVKSVLNSSMCADSGSGPPPPKAVILTILIILATLNNNYWTMLSSSWWAGYERELPFWSLKSINLSFHADSDVSKQGVSHVWESNDSWIWSDHRGGLFRANSLTPISHLWWLCQQSTERMGLPVEASVFVKAWRQVTTAN